MSGLMDQPTRRRPNSGANELPHDLLNLSEGVLARDLFGRTSRNEVVHQPLDNSQNGSLNGSQAVAPVLKMKRAPVHTSMAAEGLEAIGAAVWKLDLRSGRVDIDESSKVLFSRTLGIDPGCLEEGRFGFTTYAHPDDKDRLLALLANGPVVSESVSGEAAQDTVAKLRTTFRVVDTDGAIRWISLKVVRSNTDPKNELWFFAENQTKEIAEEERQKKLLADRILSSLMASSNGETLDSVEPKPISTIDLMNQINEKWQPLIEAKKIRWIGPDSAPMGPASSISGSPALLTMLTDCLFENAIEALFASPNLHPWIRFEFFEDDESVFLAVSDSGSGIAIVHRGSLFDPFFSTHPEKSSGLGLTIARSAAEWHGGTLRLDHFSKNTRFIAQIPKRVAKA